MTRHKNLKSKEACKEETCISDNCFSQTGLFFAKIGFFLSKCSYNAVFKACSFTVLPLKKVRHLFVDSIIYIFPDSRESRKIKK